ncbi:maltose O-acetyltransferase [Anaerovibrio sp. JC8]|uniref:hypothetical protein n=1 Tax=Anaerovibrio sp. JC8 TaxID=1240085 RepID=UPI000A0A6635|nr:hypothetical protein [Anaerovibrio sp. JC8]ORU00550.1 maltose O-acetyltransferase [Anaerovibrio sp. JC8]
MHKIINTRRQLKSICSDKAVFIYGAKTIAERICEFLENSDGRVKAFLVSNKYENPTVLCNKPVLRIEELITEHFGTVIVAVGWQFSEEIVKELSQYNIDSLGVISPLFLDDLPMDIIKSNGCKKISPHTAIAEDTHIFADKTSEILIESGVVIHSKVRIFASQGSRITISKNTLLHESSFVWAEEANIIVGRHSCLSKKSSLIGQKSFIIIGDSTTIGEEAKVSAKEESSLYIGNNCSIGNRTICDAARHATVKLGTKIRLQYNGRIAADGGMISIGDGTTMNSNFQIGCERSKIEIGEDNMFSFYIKMDAGSHEIIDVNTNSIIDNSMPIVTGNHVWLGLGSTLLPGCSIGEGTIIGALSLVNKSVPSNSICAGIPSRVIRNNIKWRRIKTGKSEC